MMYKTLMISIVILFLCSCQKKNSFITDYGLHETFILGDTMTIAHNQTVINEDENISLEFKSLVYDCRCPINGLCKQIGHAEVRLSFSSNENQKDLYLHTVKGSVRETEIYGFNIMLVDLFPYQCRAGELNSEQHLAYVVISRK